MTLRHLRAAALAGAAALSLGLAVPAHAQWTVFDPTNYTQNVLTAARELQQINHQITQIQNQAQSLINQARNLANLPYSSLQQLQQSITRTQQLLAQAQGVAFNVQQIDHAFQTSYAPASTSASSQSLIQGAQQRWQQSVQALQDAMRTQATVVGNLPTNATQMSADRRTYHVEMRSTVGTYMASLSWSYPQDQLIVLLQQSARAEAVEPIASGIDLTSINFRYAVEGDSPTWRPLRAYDDGRQVFIEFPHGIAQGEMPPLWVIDAVGGAELVNYRVRDRFMVVDRLFAAAELRLGGKKQQVVRIVRIDRRPAS